MERPDIIEEFYGVYLLKCLNTKYKGQTYIGYTVDPKRRIKQHNKGKIYGGAWRTSQRGPWYVLKMLQTPQNILFKDQTRQIYFSPLDLFQEMTLIVHGFPSEIAALRFEWAWQHPTKSRRLKFIIKKKKASESSFEFCLKVMFTMLRIPPWCRLPLTVRWFSADVMIDPPPNLTPPMHMPIVYGPVISKKLRSPKKNPKSELNASTEEEKEELHVCRLCYDLIEKNKFLICLNKACQAFWHVVCLAQHFLKKETLFIGTQSDSSEAKNILPVEGYCPECDSVMLWGDLVRKKKGCYNQVVIIENNLSDDFI